MSNVADLMLSVIVPVYNESAGLKKFHESLLVAVQETVQESYEIIYCDDGSTDSTAAIVQDWHAQNLRIKLIKFSRNFGKENALTAGIAQASGPAIIMLDGDSQHPVKLIPQFFAAWQQGAQVVVGVRSSNSQEGWLKRFGSRLFYQLFNRLTKDKLLPGSTDFRLIDRSVQTAFLRLRENSRITRGLIDWLGFQRQYIYFHANRRQAGSPGYNWQALFKLASNSLVSLTATPLYLFGYLGVFITAGAFLLGLAVIVEQLILSDPWHWKFTGTAMLGILILFLVGIVLMSQGILSLYMSHIQSQTKGRPLYVIDYAHSAGLSKTAYED